MLKGFEIVMTKRFLLFPGVLQNIDESKCERAEKEIIEGICLSYDMLKGICLETMKACEAMEESDE